MIKRNLILAIFGEVLVGIILIIVAKIFEWNFGFIFLFFFITFSLLLLHFIRYKTIPTDNVIPKKESVFLIKNSNLRISFGIIAVIILLIGNVVLLIPSTSEKIQNFYFPTSDLITTNQQSLITETITQTQTNEIANTTTLSINTVSPSITHKSNEIIASVTPSYLITATSTPNEGKYSIAITEIMSHPCGLSTKNVNEYIELYNYGDEVIDVGGWFISTSRQLEPDEIVSWNERSVNFPSNENLIFDSTEISPNQYAILLSPLYHLSNEKPIMPYIFPEDTIILTIKSGDYLGHKVYGMWGAKTAITLDGVFLYIGTDNFIGKVISTYGLSIFGTDPNAQKGYKENLPLGVESCQTVNGINMDYAVQRIIASERDFYGNWEIIKFGNPGSGPYD
jgi:hypothetical protein